MGSYYGNSYVLLQLAALATTSTRKTELKVAMATNGTSTVTWHSYFIVRSLVCCDYP